MSGRQGRGGPGANGHGGETEKETHGVSRRRLGCSDLMSVPEVRRVLRDLLRHWGRSDTAHAAELLASELVTNALLHTDHGAVVTATVASSTLRVEVRDFMAGMPVPRQAVSHLGTNGRGLLLVQSLADAWGVRTHGDGKVVWFELHEEPA